MRIMFSAILAVTMAPMWATPTLAQEKPGDKMIYQYLCAETDKLSKKFLDGATAIDEWKKKRPRLHREYMYMLGLDPLPEKTPLKVTFTRSFSHERVIIDCLHFQSRPGLYVTANLYRPAEGSEPPPKSRAKRYGQRKRFPAVLYVCGHSNRGRDGSKSAYQEHGIWFANHGYICIILDTLQLGEIPGVHHGTYGVPYNHLSRYGIKDKNIKENRWWWHAAGYTPAGVECWNGIRAIDYLVSRPDVDPKRIAVTGISGGGAATFWIAAADERVACAVPVSGMSDLESYVKNKVINGHCDCMFLYNTFRWDWTTIAALVAPRPLLFANSDNDRIFPMDGNRRIIKKLRKIYKMYGKPQLVDDYVSEGGHAYRPDLRKAIFRFINKHMKGVNGPVQDSADYKLVEGEKLRVFPTDADIPKDQINTRIDERFVPRAKVKLPGKGEFGEWKKGLLAELRDKCFRPFPSRIPAAKNLRQDGELSVRVQTEGRFENYYVFSGGFDARFAVIRNPEDAKSLIKKYSISYATTRGTKYYWTTKSPPNYVERAHILLGRNKDLGAVWDICAIARFAVEFDDKNRKTGAAVYGEGQAGILAAYAALFEPSIKEVVIIDPPTSHKQGPYFLNVLRVLDIPEALGLLAPRVKLTLVNAKDKAFDRTAEIYRLAGAAEKFVRK